MPYIQLFTLTYTTLVKQIRGNLLETQSWPSICQKTQEVQPQKKKNKTPTIGHPQLALLFYMTKHNNSLLNPKP
jgi:hypothetical protein